MNLSFRQATFTKRKFLIRGIIRNVLICLLIVRLTPALGQIHDQIPQRSIESSFTSTILDNISCLVGQDYSSDEMVGFFQASAVNWDLRRGPLALNWYGSEEGFNLRADIKVDYNNDKRTYLHQLVIESQDDATPALFSNFMEEFDIPDQPKEAEKALKKDGRYVECVIMKWAIQLILKQSDGLVVEVYWDRADKKKLFVKEMRFRRWNLKDDCKTFLFPRQEFSLEKWSVDANDPATYWNLLGRNLSSWERRNLLLLHGLEATDRGLRNVGEDIEFLIALNEMDDGFRVSEIYYYPQNGIATPIGPGTAWSHSELAEKFGKPYKSLTYQFRLMSGHWLSDDQTRFIVDFELVGNPTPTTTSMAFKPFNPDSFVHVPNREIDEILGEFCVFGNCDTGVGISQYSDGYRFVGQFENGKRSYGYVKDVNDNRVGDVDNRPAKPRQVDPNDQKLSIRSALSAINGSQDQVWVHWKSYIDNSSKMYVAGTSEERTKYFGYSRKDLEQLLALCHTLNKRYAEAKSVIYEGDICLGLVQNINDLSKVRDDVFDIANAVSLGSFNKPSYQSFTDYIEPKYNEMVALCKQFDQQWHDMAQEFNECIAE